jgi:hypothetical protein
MLEAKSKDSALLKLSEELKELTGIERISDGEFILHESGILALT